METVTICEESLCMRVGDWLKKRGFYPSCPLGIEEQFSTCSNSMGILYKDPNHRKGLPKKYLFGLISVKSPEPRKIFLGALWFDWPRGGAKRGEKWVFQAYGDEIAKKVTRPLLEEMSKEFNIDISVHLVERCLTRENHIHPDYE